MSVGDLRFKNISLNDKSIIDDIRFKYGHNLYSHTFTTMYLWKQILELKICFLGEAFVLSTKEYGEIQYYFPCGKETDKVEIIEKLRKNANIKFCYVTTKDIELLDKYYPAQVNFYEDRNAFSYIYDKKQQIEMIGSQFKKLRREVKIGKNLCEWIIEPICDENIHRVTLIAEEWNKLSKHDGAVDFMATTKAIQEYKQMNMWGLLFGDKDRDYAFMLGSFTSDEIYDVNICKTILSNIDCYIKYELYKRLPEKIRFIDSEDDMGIEGLRHHKMSRVPSTLVTVWKVEVCR